MWSMGWFWGAHFIGFLMMVAFWGLIIWGVWSLVRSANSAQKTEGDKGIQVLRERFARGEISEEEYHARVQVLKGE